MTNIAVAIPCYNGAKFVGRCIEAVLNQTHPPDEVLVINDGSTDESREIIVRYPVHLIEHRKNKGLARSRNTALKNTNADILIYVDVDAFADSNMVASLSNAFSDPEVSGCGGRGVEAIQKNIYDRWRMLHASQWHGPQKKKQVDHLFGLCMAYRTKILREAGGFDARYVTNAEDIDMGYRLTKAGHRLSYLPEAKVYHQRQDNYDSLRKMVYRWYYWAFVAKKRNGYNPWSLLVGTLRRLLWSDVWPDLFKERQLGLVSLDIEMAWVKLSALIQAAHDTRSHQSHHDGQE